MPQRSPTPTRRTRTLLLGAGALLGLLVVVGLQLGGSSNRSPNRSASTAAQATSALDTTASERPRRTLVPRTTADTPVEQTRMMVCPLEAFDAGTGVDLEADALELPDTLQVAFSPPIIGPATIELFDGEAHFPKDTAERMRHLPFKDGTVYGEDPDVGPVSITFEQGECARMQLLVLGAPPPDSMACALGDDVSLDEIRRLSYAAGPRAGQTISARPWKGAILLEAIDSEGEGWAHRAEGPPIPFSWGPDGCDDIEPMGTAQVTVRIENRPDDRPVWIGGCGSTRFLEVGTASVELEVPAVPCALEAWRVDGALRAISHLETLDPSPDERLTVTLTLPEEQMAGLGIQFMPDDDFVQVIRVLPGTPAWDAGLRRGDRILSVNDEPVGGLETSDFIVLGTGPVGTEAELLVESEDGQVEVIRVERALVDRQM